MNKFYIFGLLLFLNSNILAQSLHEKESKQDDQGLSLTKKILIGTAVGAGVAGAAVVAGPALVATASVLATKSLLFAKACGTTVAGVKTLLTLTGVGPAAAGAFVYWNLPEMRNVQPENIEIDNDDPIDQEVKNRRKLLVNGTVMLLGMSCTPYAGPFISAAISKGIAAFAVASVPTQISVVYYGTKAGRLVKGYYYPSAEQKLQMLLKYESSRPSFEERLRRISQKEVKMNGIKPLQI